MKVNRVKFLFVATTLWLAMMGTTVYFLLEAIG